MTITASEREALDVGKRAIDGYELGQMVGIRCDVLRILLAIAERAAVEPVAWKMVPVEPTAEMISAGIAAEISAPHIIDGKGWHATDFKAAVSLSYKAMLAVALAARSERATKPVAEPVAWRWKKRINCGQGQFIEGHWIYTDTDPKADHVDFQSIIAYEPLYAAPSQEEDHGR